MPWRLIQFIAIFAVFLLFIVFNLDNRSDISLGFTKFSDVPVFITAFFAFIVGMTLTLPSIVRLWFRTRKSVPPAAKKGKGRTKKGDEKGGKTKAPDSPSPGQAEPVPADLKDFGID